MSLLDTVTTTQLSTLEAAQRTQAIFSEALHNSSYVDEPNFRSIHPDDLRRLAELYDREFFAGQLLPQAEQTGLTFRLSQRMTKAGGTTTKRRWRRGAVQTKSQYEIAVSTTLLYQTFQDVDRPIMMSGIRCTTRLEALQRVMEHELIHLVELMLWDDSSCNAPRFHRIAHNFFAHTEHRHSLVTQQERAYSRFGIRTGDYVGFKFEGRRLEGYVNRITRRATILVMDPRGELYSDGTRYAKYYVPIDRLARLDNQPGRRAIGT